MKISVVTVCYNSAATISDTIRSFLAQTYAQKEMLIIDGASTDGTLEIVTGLQTSEIRILSEPDRGIYDAMNKGLRQFAGDAVGFLNSDDVFHDEHTLAHIAEALQRADIVYGDLRMVTDHQNKTVVRVWHSGAYSRYSYHLGWMPPHPTFYVRRPVVARTGEFDLSYRIAADYDYMLRAMMLNDFRVQRVARTLVDFKVGGLTTGSWESTIGINLECLRSRRQHLGAPPIDAALVLRPLRRIAQLRLRSRPSKA